MGMRWAGIGSWVSFVVFVVAAVPAAVAQDGLPDSRSTPAPVVSIPLNGGMPPPQSGLRNSVLNLLQQVEELQSQVRKLRNEVEIQSHSLQVMQQQQQNLIGDLDRRVSALEARSQAGTAAAGAVAGSTASVPATQPTPNELQAYNGAFDLMKEGFYDRAIAAFRAFIRNLRNHPSTGMTGSFKHSPYRLSDGRKALGVYSLMPPAGLPGPQPLINGSSHGVRGTTDPAMA